MPEKILRFGFTEFTLLFCYWYQTFYNNKTIMKTNNINELKKNMIKWFYTTSGYYDNTIISNYMNAEHKNNIDPLLFNKYFEISFNFIQNCDSFSFGIHYNRDDEVFKEFYNNLNIKMIHGHEIFFNKIKDKKILVISPFAKLFKLQFESGNCKKIYNNFPNVNKIYFYTNIYTFFNKGPHNNIFETVDFLIEDITKNIPDDYETVVISGGAYSILIAEKFYNLNKSVYTLGGELQSFFGVLNSRSKSQQKILNNIEFYITDIPEEYKPEGYMKIENGCYW